MLLPTNTVRVKGRLSLKIGMWHDVRIYAGNKFTKECALFLCQFYNSSSFFDAADSS